MLRRIGSEEPMKRVLAAAALAAAGLTLAGCAHSQGQRPDPATCKSAMRADYKYALAHPSASPAAEPAACRGVPQPTLSQYVTQIMEGQ